MGYKKNKKKRPRQRGNREQENNGEESSSEEKNEKNSPDPSTDPLFLRIRKSYDDLTAHKERAHTEIDPVTGDKVETQCACTRYVEFVLDLLRTEINGMSSDQPSSEYAERLKNLIASCAGSGPCQDPNIIGEHSKGRADSTAAKKPSIVSRSENVAGGSSSATIEKDISEKDRSNTQKKVRFSLFEKPSGGKDKTMNEQPATKIGFKIKLNRPYLLDFTKEDLSNVTLADLLPKVSKKQRGNATSIKTQSEKTKHSINKEATTTTSFDISDIKADKNRKNEQIGKLKDNLTKNTNKCVKNVDSFIEIPDNTINDKPKEDTDIKLQGEKSIDRSEDENIQKYEKDSIDKMDDKSLTKNVEAINNLEEPNEIPIDIPMCFGTLDKSENIICQEKEIKNNESNEIFKPNNIEKKTEDPSVDVPIYSVTHETETNKSEPEHIEKKIEDTSVDLLICSEALNKSEDMLCEENETEINESNEKSEPDHIENKIEDTSVDLPICSKILDKNEDISCEENEIEINQSNEKSEPDHIEKKIEDTSVDLPICSKALDKGEDISCVENETKINESNEKSKPDHIEKKIEDTSVDLPVYSEALDKNEDLSCEENEVEINESNEKSEPDHIKKKIEDTSVDLLICSKLDKSEDISCKENEIKINESNEKSEPDHIQKKIKDTSVDLPICSKALGNSEDILCEENETKINENNEKSEPGHTEKKIEDTCVDLPICSKTLDKSEDVLCKENEKDANKSHEPESIDNIKEITDSNNKETIKNENVERTKSNENIKIEDKNIQIIIEQIIKTIQNSSTNNSESKVVSENTENIIKQDGKKCSQLLENIDKVIGLIKNDETSSAAESEDKNVNRNTKPGVKVVKSPSENKVTTSIEPIKRAKGKSAKSDNKASENKDDKTIIDNKNDNVNRKLNKNVKKPVANKDPDEKKILQSKENENKEESISNNPDITKTPIKKNKKRRPKKRNKKPIPAIAPAEDNKINISKSAEDTEITIIDSTKNINTSKPIENTETNVLKPIDNNSTNSLKLNNNKISSTLPSIEETSELPCDSSPNTNTDKNLSLEVFRVRLAKHKFRDPSEYEVFVPRNLNLLEVQQSNKSSSDKAGTSTNVLQNPSFAVGSALSQNALPNNKIVSRLLITDSSGSESSSTTSLIPTTTDQSPVLYSTHSFMWIVETVLLILQGALAGAFRISHNYEGPLVPLIVQNTMHSIRLSLNTIITHFSYTSQEKFEPRTSILRELLMPVINALQDFCPGLSLHAANFFGPLQNVPSIAPLPSYCVQPREVNGMYLYETIPAPPVISAPRVPLLNNEDNLRAPHLGVFVTADGLIRFCLRNTIQIDVTLDDAICLTNLKDKTRMAISASGHFAGIISPLAQVYQHGQVVDMTIKDTQAAKKRQAKICQRGIYFKDSSSPQTYLLQEDGTSTSNCEFAELNDDFIFSVFFGNSMRGPVYYHQCVTALHSLLKTEVLEDGSIHYYIGKIKISQYRNGHVHVNRKFTNFTMLNVPEVLNGNALNPVDQKGFARLTTPVCRITTSVTTVADNPNMKLFLVNYKNLCVHYSVNDLIVSNDDFSAGFTNLYRQQ